MVNKTFFTTHIMNSNLISVHQENLRGYAAERLQAEIVHYLNQQLQLPAIKEVNLAQTALGHLEEDR